MNEDMREYLFIRQLPQKIAWWIFVIIVLIILSIIMHKFGVATSLLWPLLKILVRKDNVDSDSIFNVGYKLFLRNL